ncbi:hypothetical protein MJH12_18430 [bacterium]|nr:hypothetical protein [bacterium]
MNQCTEFAVFKVKEENIQRVRELSELIFSEMNLEKKVILDYQVLCKTDAKDTLCWHLTWLDEQSAQSTTQKWPSFPSTKEFQSLVLENLYYGHFIASI